MTTDKTSAKAAEKRNANRFVWANGLQNIGDQILSAKTVLPWLFSAAGVPHLFTGLLVPIRESGSMLPQAAFSPWITSRNSRKRLWILGSLGQGIAGVLIALSAFLLRGAALGIAAVVFLGVLSLCRALCSVAGKDVQGRTISKGTRGKVTGRATALGGAVTLLVGIALYFADDLSVTALATISFGAALTWFVAAGVFTGIAEPTPDGEKQGIDKAWWRDTWDLYTGDRRFRTFVHVRALLLVSALSTSFIVTLSLQAGTEALTGLGGFVLASGLAALVGGRVTGGLADRSPQRHGRRRGGRLRLPGPPRRRGHVVARRGQRLGLPPRLFRGQPRTHRDPGGAQDLRGRHGHRRRAHPLRRRRQHDDGRHPASRRRDFRRHCTRRPVRGASHARGDRRHRRRHGAQAPRGL